MRLWNDRTLSTFVHAVAAPSSCQSTLPLCLMRCSANWMQQQYIYIYIYKLGFESLLGWHKAQLWWTLRNCTLYISPFRSCAAYYNAVLCCPENNWCNDMQVYAPVAHFKCHVLFFFSCLLYCDLLCMYSLSQSSPLQVVCACAHVYEPLLRILLWPFCYTETEVALDIVLSRVFFFRRTYVHFNLCVSVTIYICILILATQCAEAFNSFFFLAISVFMCTCVCEHVYVCTCLGALSGCCIFFLHTIPSIFF